MKYIIDEDVIKSKGLTVDQFLLMFLLDFNSSEAERVGALVNLNLAKKASLLDVTQRGVKYNLTASGQLLLKECLDSSSKGFLNEDTLIRIGDLAEKLKALYPKGKKPGTNIYWAEGKALIIKRLKQFFKKYGASYTNEDIISATERYIQSFNGNYKFMKTLKYFIFKEEKGAGGDIESTSELLTYLDNSNEQSLEDEDWTTRTI